MLFPAPLQSGTLIRRYKRFLADVRLEDGRELTLHCPNTGAMTGCAEPGSKVFFSQSNNPKRKYPHTWELTHTAQGYWICVNTARANQLIEEAIHKQQIPGLRGYASLNREVRYGEENSRIDILLQDHPSEPDAFVEVKSVTLLAEEFGSGRGFFPDAVSVRGQKHLRELGSMVAAGKRAVLVFAVLHSGITSVAAASHIDEQYAQLLSEAVEQGVEVIAVSFSINPEEMVLSRVLQVHYP